MKKFFEDFKKFALRGNVLDMAVGVIIGGAFTAIVTALTANFIQPLLTANFIQPLLTAFFTWEWNAWVDSLGASAAAFLTAVVNFILTAFILFLLLKGITALLEIGKKKPAPAAPTTKKCPFCKSDIAIEATRCPHCTSEL